MYVHLIQASSRHVLVEQQLSIPYSRTQHLVPAALILFLHAMGFATRNYHAVTAASNHVMSASVGLVKRWSMYPVVVDLQHLLPRVPMFVKPLVVNLLSVTRCVVLASTVVVTNVEQSVAQQPNKRGTKRHPYAITCTNAPKSVVEHYPVVITHAKLGVIREDASHVSVSCWGYKHRGSIVLTFCSFTEAVFDEVTCHCGQTRLEPPVRCGTTLPPCPHPCTRPSPCGHVRLLQHNCHPDNETCPPCAMLVTRTCVCGKTELKNVPCYRESPRCGRICDKPLSCGRHLCNKSCHSGTCLTDEQVCTQQCNGKRSCGHPCTARCHGSDACPEEEPCQTMVRVACKCGQNALQVPCNATATSTGSKRELDCNDFCAKVERNRKLAMALEIDPEKAEEPAPSIDELGYFDDPLCEFYLENRTWCKQMETTLIDFAKGSKQVLHFKPMKSNFRRFIHRYCVHFNLGTEAVDPEPYRSVVVRKSLGQARIPSPLLSVAAHHPSMNRPPAAPVAETNGLKSRPQQPVNALCLSDLAFGLIETELDLELAKAFGDVSYKSQWQTESDSVLVFPLLDDKLPVDEKEDMIWQLKKAVKDVVVSSGKAARVDCCWVDRLGKITWTERKGILEQEQALEQQQQQQQQQRQQQSKNVFDVLSSGTDESSDATVSGVDKDAWDQEEPAVTTTLSKADKSPSEDREVVVAK